MSETTLHERVCLPAGPMLAGTDPDDFHPLRAPSAIMKPGKVARVPVFVPCDPATGAALRGLAEARVRDMAARFDADPDA